MDFAKGLEKKHFSHLKKKLLKRTTSGKFTHLVSEIASGLQLEIILFVRSLKTTKI